MNFLGQLTALIAILVLSLSQVSATRNVHETISRNRAGIQRANNRETERLQKLDSRSLKQAQSYFTNPILRNCPDPAIYSDFVNKYYYLTCTRQDYIWLWRSKDPARFNEADHTVIFNKDPNPSSDLSTELWAPEIHYAFDQWVIYFTSRNGNDPTSHKVFVTTNPAADPFTGTWAPPLKVNIPGDPWAIDPSIYSANNIYYFLFTGYTTPGVPSSGSGIYIGKLSSVTDVGAVNIIAVPTFLFSRFAGDNSTTAAVNEAPHFWSHDDQAYITFSASDCSSDNYAIGLLYKPLNEDPLQSTWKKYPDPVVYKNTTGGVYATGHNGFFKDVNGCNDWIVFHANSQPDQGCGDTRAAHIQPFGYNASNGLPSFGGPAQGLDEPIPKPGVFS